MTKTNKKRQVTRKPIKVSERREIVDKQTGEVVDEYVFKIEERDANFHKLWLWHLAAALDLIGNQKIKILSHILENTRQDNIFIGSQQAIADATETATQTVTITMKMLMVADIIKMQQRGVYMINPDVIFRGDAKKRMNILYEYHDTSKEKKNVRSKK